MSEKPTLNRQFLCVPCKKTIMLFRNHSENPHGAELNFAEGAYLLVHCPFCGENRKFDFDQKHIFAGYKQEGEK